MTEQIEVKAEELGWTPKEAWVEKGGDPDRWRTADEFMEYGERNVNFVRKSLEKEMDDKLSAANAEFSERLSRIESVSTKAIEATQHKSETERQGRIKQWTQFRDKAAADDNLTDYNKALTALSALEGQAPAPTQTNGQDTQSAESVTFHSKFMPLIGQNNAVGKFSDDAAATIRRDNPNISEADYFNELSTRIEERFGDDYPQFFGRAVKKQTTVESSDGDVSKGKETYASLPDEAKKACDEFVKDGLMTKKDYLSSYFGE